MKQNKENVEQDLYWSINDRYVVMDRIGSGGMAEIYRAKMFGAAGFEKEFAIKMIRPHLLDDAEFVEMFVNEAKLSVSLSQTNIVQIFDFGLHDQRYYIVMEYVEGKDLLDILARCVTNNIRIPFDIALHLVSELLKGLDFAHRATDVISGESLNIIHRDISPSNILISYNGVIKIGDFGVAKARLKQTMSRTGTLKGKVGYMSPEQVVGKDIDLRSDVFAAGIILFEVLSTTRLFRAESDFATMVKVRECDIDAAIERIRRLPSGLERILRTALARDPNDRYESAAHFGQALNRYINQHNLVIDSSKVTNLMQRLFANDIERQKRKRHAEVIAFKEFREKEAARERARAHANRLAQQRHDSGFPSFASNAEDQFRSFSDLRSEHSKSYSSRSRDRFSHGLQSMDEPSEISEVVGEQRSSSQPFHHEGASNTVAENGQPIRSLESLETSIELGNTNVKIEAPSGISRSIGQPINLEIDPSDTESNITSIEDVEQKEGDAKLYPDLTFREINAALQPFEFSHFWYRKAPGNEQGPYPRLRLFDLISDNVGGEVSLNGIVWILISELIDRGLRARPQEQSVSGAFNYSSPFAQSIIDASRKSNRINLHDPILTEHGPVPNPLIRGAYRHHDSEVSAGFKNSDSKSVTERSEPHGLDSLSSAPTEWSGGKERTTNDVSHKDSKRPIPVSKLTTPTDAVHTADEFLASGRASRIKTILPRTIDINSEIEPNHLFEFFQLNRPDEDPSQLATPDDDIFSEISSYEELNGSNEVINGHFDLMSFPRLLASIYRIRFTGSIVFENDGNLKELFFYRGTPISAVSNLESERFGQLLVSQGLITEKQRTEALGIAKGTDQPLGTILVNLKMIDTVDLAEVVNYQFERKILDLFTWERARFKIDPGQLPHDGQRSVSHDLYPLLGVGCLHYSPYELIKATYHNRMDERIVLNKVFTSNFDRFRVGPKAIRLMRLFATGETLNRIISRVPPDRIELAFRLFYLLHQTGELRVEHTRIGIEPAEAVSVERFSQGQLPTEIGILDSVVGAEDSFVELRITDLENPDAATSFESIVEDLNDVIDEDLDDAQDMTDST